MSKVFYPALNGWDFEFHADRIITPGFIFRSPYFPRMRYLIQSEPGDCNLNMLAFSMPSNAGPYSITLLTGGLWEVISRLLLISMRLTEISLMGSQSTLALFPYR